ncbi:MAG: PAS domain S-box protein [Planctomycetales bacterium]|nr:PAS domain S-box protein [Planctomycetales bacterium]
MSVILAASVLIRVLAACWSVAVVRRLGDRRVLFLTAMLVLMATRQAWTLANGLSGGSVITLDTLARLDELPGLFVSLIAFLLVLNLEGLVDRAAHRQRPAPSLGGTPIWPVVAIGAGSIVGVVAVSFFAYENSRSAVRQHVATENLAVGRTVSGIALSGIPSDVPLDKDEALERISRAWSQTSVSHKGTYLCVIGSDGRLELHSLKPEMKGTDVGGTTLSKASGQTVNDLLKAHGNWSGQNTNFRGFVQLVGYHYVPEIDSLMAVHVPVKSVDAEFRTAAAPWIWSIALIGGMLMPLALGLLYHNARRRHAQALASLAALRESEEKFRLLTESSPAVVFIVRDDRIVYGNPMFAVTMGCSIARLTTLHVDDVVAPQQRAAFHDRLGRLLAGETTFQRFDLQITTAQGELRWLDFAAQRIDYSGAGAVLATCVDVTEQKTAAESLRLKETQLAHVSRLSTMGEMVAGIAHEINQPLSAIANFATASKNAVEKDGRPFDAPVGDWLTRIHDQAVRCGEIIQRLRRFVKKNPVDHEWTDLKRVVTESLALVDNDLRQISCIVDCRLPDEEVNVHGNAVELQQVVVNLLRNACDAVRDQPAPQIGLRVVRQADHARLTIHDNGPGVDASQLGSLFDAFFTTKSHGMGMGLAISKSIIESHGGNLRFNPAETPGATFYFELPADAAALEMGMAAT